MIYIGNGMYSDSGPNDYLQHYGVLGMKWGVRRGKQKTNQSPVKRTSNDEIDSFVKTLMEDWGMTNKEEAREVAIDELKRQRREKIKERNYVAYLETEEGQKKAFDDAKDSYSKQMLEEYLKEKGVKLYHSDTIAIPSLQHDDMNDINNYLCHYGVVGMKWGVRKARSHIKNIYYGRLSKSKSIGDMRSAKLKYREDMKSIREFAKQNKKNKDVKVSDIEKAARDKAKSHFDDDYDTIDRKIKTRRAIDNALTGAAAGLGAASMIYQGKQNRKYEQSHGLTSHMPGSHKYVLDNSRGTKAADALGYASIGLLGASVIPQSSRNKYRRMMNEKFHE